MKWTQFRFHYLRLYLLQIRKKSFSLGHVLQFLCNLNDKFVHWSLVVDSEQ